MLEVLISTVFLSFPSSWVYMREVSVVIACPLCVVLGSLPNWKVRWFTTEHGQKTTTPRSHVDSQLTERAKKSEPERSVHHRLHLILSATSMMTKRHESVMSSAMGGGSSCQARSCSFVGQRFRPLPMTLLMTLS